MENKLTSQNQEHWLDLLNRIQPDTQPRWGSLTPTKLLAHLRRAFEISLGKIPVKDKSNFFTRRKFIRKIGLKLPLPKGVKVPPSFFPESEEDFDSEKEKLINIIGQFTETLEKSGKKVTLHPFFGPLDLQEWSAIHAAHLKHHLKQFKAL